MRRSPQWMVSSIGLVALAAACGEGAPQGSTGQGDQTIESGPSLARGAVASASASASDDLAADLDEILADPRLEGGRAAVVVRVAGTGEVLYEREAHRRMLPSSNEKLLTSAAALDILGPDHTFATTVAAQGPVHGPVLRGDLYLRGTGDPTMLAQDYAALADQVAGAGIRVVTGRLVADDTWFDDVRLGNDWTWDDEPFYYAAPVSALTVAPDTDYDAGTVIVEVRPGAAAGEPVSVDLVPATGQVAIVNSATTAAAGEGDDIAIARRHGSSDIVVSGTLAADVELSREWASVSDPTAYAADVFRAALEARGVRVLGDVAYDSTPADASTIAEHRSQPLAAILTPFLKLSNNGHAEVLVKSIGREAAGAGSWSAGLDAIRSQMEAYGLDPALMANRDGSGLSRRNLVPAAAIASLLDAARTRPWFDVWYQALPIAGEPDRMVGGTLRSRMVGTPAAGNVHGKTGTLTGASSLSGYVTDADGELLIFSILLNDHLSGKPSDLEDRIAVRLAMHSRSAPTRRRVEPPAVRLPADVECSWVKDC